MPLFSPTWLDVKEDMTNGGRHPAMSIHSILPNTRERQRDQANCVLKSPNQSIDRSISTNQSINQPIN